MTYKNILIFILGIITGWVIMGTFIQYNFVLTVKDQELGDNTTFLESFENYISNRK